MQKQLLILQNIFELEIALQDFSKSDKLGEPDAFVMLDVD